MSTMKRPGSAGRNAGSNHRDAIIVSSPTKRRYELELPPPRAPYSTFNAGVTPNFELQSDPLEAARTTPRPQDFAISRNDAASTPIGKMRSFNEGTKHPISSHVSTIARQQHLMDSPDQKSSVPVYAHHTASNSSSSSRSVTRQSSMSKGQSSHDAISGRNTPQMAAYISNRPGSANSISRRHVTSPETIVDRQYSQSPTFEYEDVDDEQDKGHRIRRQSSMNSTGRWTPTILGGIMRKTASSPVNALNQKQKSHSDQQEGVIEAEIQHLTSQGRKTPAKYQSQHINKQEYEYYPPTTLQSKYTSHPQSHAHKVSTSTIGSNSSHSIQIQLSPSQSHSRRTSLAHSSPHLASHSRHTSKHALSPTLQQSPTVADSTVSTASSSPLVIPHARRGAINLRPAGRRKRAALAQRRRAAELAAQSPRMSPLRQLQHFTYTLIEALKCPVSTAHAIVQYAQGSLHSIDKSFRDARTGERVWKPTWLSAYIPLLIWLIVSLSSTISVLIWHTEVFQALDRLSVHLQEMGLAGRFLLGSLIFLTTFPPLPLYSTLIILCGFSFGLLQGFIISYVAALSGAIVVFLLSRSLLKTWMVGLLNKSGGMKRVVRAIEKRPKLLFLVRLAPYPYNLMNTLLASSPTLTLRTYTICTALALPKLLVHCALGTSIKNFAAYNGAATPPLRDDDNNNDADSPPPLIGYDPSADAASTGNAETIKHIFGFVGLGLCIGIFIYLFSVARKAVDEELDDEDYVDEYGILLSGDEGEFDDEEEEEEDDDDEQSSELDKDELCIAAHMSNDSNNNDSTPMLHRRTSLPASTNIQSAQVASRKFFNSGGSDLTLVSDMGASYTQAGESILFSTAPYKTGLEYDDTSSQNNNSNPYPYQKQQQQYGYCNRGNRHQDSQVSLADSIAEMEKHAVEMEQEIPPFQRNHLYDEDTPLSDNDGDYLGDARRRVVM